MITTLRKPRFLIVTILVLIALFIIVSVVWATTRQQVTDRAQTWVNARVPYSMSAYRNGYRTDCSGFVSYAWNLRDNAGNPKSPVTGTLPNVSTRISKNDLQSGDILLNTADGKLGHAVIFDRWANSQKTYYYAYEMTTYKDDGVHDGAQHHMIPYPYWPGHGIFVPYRYNGLTTGDTDDDRSMSYGQTLNGTISPSRDRDTYSFSGSSGDTITIRMNKTDAGLDPYVELWKDGRLIGQDDDRGGSLNSRLVTTLSDSGTYQIVAHAYVFTTEGDTTTGRYSLQLTKETAQDPDDYRWISYGQSRQGTISPNNDRDTYYFGGTAGRVISIRMNKIDSGLNSYLELWGPSGYITSNNDGGGNRNSWLVTTLPSNGTYRIIARSLNHSSNGRYTLSVGRVTASNLAQGKSAFSSSIERSGLEARRAFDGNMGTRWSSRFIDPGWIVVDLGSVHTISQVVLRWEAAYGRRYGILTSSSSQCCSDLRWAYYTTRGNGGVDTINFSPRTARWVVMYGFQRGTPWGYSLYEFEVYDTAATVIPIVPPDEPGQDDTIPLEEPLLPTSPGKEVEALAVGVGEDGQEDVPLAESPTGEPPLINTNYYTPTANIDIITPTTAYQGVQSIHFSGSGVDNDEAGESIIAYAWSSSLDGPIGIGYSPVFTWTSDMLAVGTHVISLTVQDNEGIWSEAATSTLEIKPSNKIYLPIIVK